MRWGQDGDNFMDHGGDEVVSYSPCQSILRPMMLLWCRLCHWLWLWRMNHFLIYHSVTYYQVWLVWNNDNYRSLTDGPCQICPSSLACSWTVFLLQYKNSSPSSSTGVNMWPPKWHISVMPMAHNITTLKISDQDDVKVTFTYQCGPGPTFWWPHWETIRSVPTENVLSVVGIFALIAARNNTISRVTLLITEKLHEM